jgi:hypothetical protein
VPCDATEHYRNKAVYTISEENGVPVFGFYRAGATMSSPLTDACCSQKPPTGLQLLSAAG